MPRARVTTATRATAQWLSELVPRYQRRSARVDEAILGVYLSGTNSRQIKGALAPLRSVAAVILAVAVTAPSAPALARFFEATSPDERASKPALTEIAASWKDGYAAMVIDMARQMRPARGPREANDEPALAPDDERTATAPGRPSADLTQAPERGSPIRQRLIGFLEKQTKRSFGDDLNRWREWMWALPYDPHPDYATFKGMVYGQIDPRMQAFFPPNVRALIRLDEIDWGGVIVNGIPPLRDPRAIPAAAANYLRDSNVVFGLVVNGEARAYPKRILAWHEMAIDRVGGVDLTIVYCTLCGTVIPFESQASGRRLHFGTSGLLYRSNKLMFDEETKSLWSTFEGVPVVGSLVGSGVTLASRPVVTTTWKEWRTEHPDTTVLSLETGYQRDYSEGAAYRGYFSTDRLMFQVSRTDARLRNKDEVLVMRAEDSRKPGQQVPVAISAQHLRRHPVFSFTAADQRFVVVTTPQGANRVFLSPVEFPEQRAGSTINDVEGRAWRVSEAALVLDGSPSRDAARVSAQRAFWFGWYAQFPDTILIK